MSTVPSSTLVIKPVPIGATAAAVQQAAASAGAQRVTSASGEKFGKAFLNFACAQDAQTAFHMLQGEAMFAPQQTLPVRVTYKTAPAAIAPASPTMAASSSASSGVVHSAPASASGAAGKPVPAAFTTTPTPHKLNIDAVEFKPVSSLTAPTIAAGGTAPSPELPNTSTEAAASSLCTTDSVAGAASCFAAMTLAAKTPAAASSHSTAGPIGPTAGTLISDHFTVSAGHGPGAIPSKLTVSLESGDITKWCGAVIVNAAKNSLMGGGGIDGAIHRAAGPGLLDACASLPKLAGQGGARCATGDAKFTPGPFSKALLAQHVIHAVGPDMRQAHRQHDGPALLKSAFLASMKAAEENHCASMAIPAISCGIFAFNPADAAKISLDAVIEFAQSKPTHVKKIVFMLFDSVHLQHWRNAASEQPGMTPLIAPHPEAAPIGVTPLHGGPGLGSGSGAGATKPSGSGYLGLTKSCYIRSKLAHNDELGFKAAGVMLYRLSAASAAGPSEYQVLLGEQCGRLAPLGGMRDQGECSVDTAVRELDEETGQQLPQDLLVGVASRLLHGHGHHAHAHAYAASSRVVWLGRPHKSPKYALYLCDVDSVEGMRDATDQLPKRYADWRMSAHAKLAPPHLKEMDRMRWVSLSALLHQTDSQFAAHPHGKSKATPLSLSPFLTAILHYDLVRGFIHQLLVSQSEVANHACPSAT